MMAGEREYNQEQFEQELKEVLREAGAHELPPPPRRAARQNRSGSVDLRLPSPKHVMIAGALLLVLEWFRLTAFLGGTAAILGLGLLAFGFVSWLLRPQKRETYWRGRRIDLDAGPAWSERWYYLVYRR